MVLGNCLFCAGVVPPQCLHAAELEAAGMDAVDGIGFNVQGGAVMEELDLSKFCGGEGRNAKPAAP